MDFYRFEREKSQILAPKKAKSTKSKLCMLFQQKMQKSGIFQCSSMLSHYFYFYF